MFPNEPHFTHGKVCVFKHANKNYDESKALVRDGSEESHRILYKPNDLVLTYNNEPDECTKPNWHGPFKIVQQEEKYFYRIEPESGGMKTKVHVKRLRLFKN